MIVAFDSSVLLLSINSESPSSGGESDYDKVAYLLESLETRKDTIIIPTPVIAEVFVKNEDRITEFLLTIQKSAYLQIANFDLKVALELAAMNRSLRKQTAANNEGRAYQAIKVDLQIIAIAEKAGLDAILLKDLPERPEPDQGSLDV